MENYEFWLMNFSYLNTIKGRRLLFLDYTNIEQGLSR
jgi:hypothetical protein